MARPLALELSPPTTPPAPRSTPAARSEPSDDFRNTLRNAQRGARKDQRAAAADATKDAAPAPKDDSRPTDGPQRKRKDASDDANAATAAPTGGPTAETTAVAVPQPPSQDSADAPSDNSNAYSNAEPDAAAAAIAAASVAAANAATATSHLPPASAPDENISVQSGSPTPTPFDSKPAATPGIRFDAPATSSPNAITAAPTAPSANANVTELPSVGAHADATSPRLPDPRNVGLSEAKPDAPQAASTSEVTGLNVQTQTAPAQVAVVAKPAQAEQKPPTAAKTDAKPSKPAHDRAPVGPPRTDEQQAVDPRVRDPRSSERLDANVAVTHREANDSDKNGETKSSAAARAAALIAATRGRIETDTIESATTRVPADNATASTGHVADSTTPTTHVASVARADVRAVPAADSALATQPLSSALTSAAAASPGADAAAVPMDRLTDVMRAHVADNRWHVSLQLDPPELGKLRLDVSMRDDGLNVRMQVGSEAVRRMVESRLPDLVHALGDGDMRVAHTQISVRESSPGPADSGPQHREGQSQPTFDHAAGRHHDSSHGSTHDGGAEPRRSRDTDSMTRIGHDLREIPRRPLGLGGRTLDLVA